MEDPTSFDLNEAIRRWRAGFGSPHSLNTAELEELESHLRDHMAALEASGMKPEAAFVVAVKRLGDRQRVATEFAKINPRRIWLERAIWMALGIFVFSVFARLTAVPSHIIANHGLGRGWNPVLLHALMSFCGLGGVAAMTTLLWLLLVRRPHWGRALVYSCERSLLATGVAMALILWGCDRLLYFYRYILYHYLPRLHDWVFPLTQAPYPDETVMNRMVFLFSVAEGMIWTAALCVLAARVARARMSQISLPSAATQQAASRLLGLDRLLWMLAGYVFVQFAAQDLGLCLLPALWAQALLGQSAVLQHSLGFAAAALELVLWLTPFWACWFFARGRSRLGDWMLGTFRLHPLIASLGVMLLINASGVLGLLSLWTGVQLPFSGSGFGQIVSEWLFRTSVLAWRVAPAVLVVALLRWRMKLRQV